MKPILDQVAQIAQQLASVIWQVLQYIWNLSFGQITKMFNMNFGSLPLWKAIIYVLVVGAIIYFLYKVAKDLLKAVQSVLGAIVGLISALVQMLPQIVWAGLIAFGGAWLIAFNTPEWMPGVLAGR